jgi:hypothetical protein
MTESFGGMKRARSGDEYVSLVRQAMDEIFDLRAAMEYDEDSMGRANAFIDRLEEGVRRLYRSMEEGTYRFATGDLPFMDVVRKADERLLPFKTLLIRINETHLKGLEVDEGS